MAIKNTFLIMLILPSLAVALQKQAHTFGINEVVMFKTKKSYSAQKIVMIANAVTPILKSYPGFISRSLSENIKDGREWIDIVRWSSLGDAQLAAKAVVKRHEMKDFMATMQNYHMYHFQVKVASPLQVK
jgi:hypothetical protein